MGAALRPKNIACGPAAVDRFLLPSWLHTGKKGQLLLRLDEVLSCTAHPTILAVAHTHSGFCFNIAMRALTACRFLVQICVEPLFSIELRAVAGQVEQLNLALPLSHPRLDQFAVVHPQIVHDQEDFFARILYQGLQEFNEFVSIKCFANDHPARLSLVGHRSDHQELLAGALQGYGCWCFARWRKASAPHIGVDQGCLSAPVDFSCLCPGALLDVRVFTFQPSLHSFGGFFAGAFDRFLWCEAPAGEVFADAARLQPDAKRLFDKLAHSRAVLQVKIHFELLGAFVYDQALDGVFLRRAEHATIASGAPASCWSDSVPTTGLKQINGGSNGGVAQPCHASDLHDLDAFFMQTHHLLAPFMKLLQRLASCAFFFHHSLSIEFKLYGDLLTRNDRFMKLRG